MSGTLRMKPRRKNSADYEVRADQLLADRERLNALMQKDRTEIDYFRVATARLEMENRIVLARLKARW